MKNLAEDWITIWQSECNAAANDRERAQAWAGMVEIWAQGGRMAVLLWPASPSPGDNAAHAPAGHSAREPPAGASTAAAAPDARDAAIDRLAQRVEELERRLAALGGLGHS